jgi:hypothetical protein
LLYIKYKNKENNYSEARTMNLLEKAKKFREKNKAKDKSLGKLEGCEDAVRYLIENGTKQSDVIAFLKQEAKISVSGYLLKKFCQLHEIKSPYSRGNSTVKKKDGLIDNTLEANQIDEQHNETTADTATIFNPSSN